eukprot:4693416-Pyramimonas_sp.AAC.1
MALVGQQRALGNARASLQPWLIASIRKSDTCRCGCKGFCTCGQLLRVLVWSFNVMASGVHPLYDHLGKAFTDDD